MIETEPVYFSEFRKFVEKKFDKMESDFDSVKESLDKVIENQETHFEAIGELKVQVTGIEMILRGKADDKDLKALEKRTGRLEKAVFA